MKTQLAQGLQTLCLVFMSVCLFAQPGAAADGKGDKVSELVARKDYDVSKDWYPRQIMGKNFWHLLGVSRDNQPDKGSWVATYMRELVDKPLFKESGLNYGNVENITVPGSNKVSISAMNPHAYLDLIETRPNAPFFIMPYGNRTLYKVIKYFEYDNKTYSAWKKAHPNFMGFVNGETENDFLTNAPWGGYNWKRLKAGLEKTGDKELMKTIVREFPKPQNREEITSQLMKGCEANRKYYFNDADKVSYMRSATCFDHGFYECGSGMGWLETTNTGSPNGSANYRHQVSLFFARGAAHQYIESEANKATWKRMY